MKLLRFLVLFTITLCFAIVLKLDLSNSTSTKKECAPKKLITNRYLNNTSQDMLFYLKSWKADVSHYYVFVYRHYKNIKRDDSFINKDKIRGGFYYVEKGDTLSDIAFRSNVSVEEIIKWNGIDCHHIYPGQELILFNPF